MTVSNKEEDGKQGNHSKVTRKKSRQGGGIRCAKTWVIILTMIEKKKDKSKNQKSAGTD